MQLRYTFWWLTILVVTAGSASAESTFKVYLETSGVYRVTFERLRESGLADAAWLASEIAVSNRQTSVANWVEDGGDGIFGPGDWIEFVGEQLRGESTYLDEYSRFNCYFVSFGVTGRPGSIKAITAQGPFIDTRELEARRHYENDVLMLRFDEKLDSEEERWYWARISVTDQKPFVFEFETPGLKSGEGNIVLKLAFRGWSEPLGRHRGTQPDHRLDITLNGSNIGSSEWNGKGHHAVELTAPLKTLVDGPNSLELRVPKRTLEESEDLLVDVVMLNSIEIVYPFVLAVGEYQQQVFAADENGAGRLAFAGCDERGFRMYTVDGHRFDVTTPVDSMSLDVRVPDRGMWIVRREGLHDPNVVVADQPSNLRHRQEPVDYIMIAHRSFLSSLAPLVEMHERRGLRVAVVDVQDVFDEFNFGIVHPRAIKDFLDAAYHGWPKPAPHFVLLVGDASWDYKNSQTADENYADWSFRPGETRRFVKNVMTTYTENAELNHRNLVPTWNFPTQYGHAASDNWFVCLDGEDARPEMAIGRFPVVSNDELDGVIRKTIAYVDETTPGPWRRKMLFITNESRGFQNQSDRIAAEVAHLGFEPEKVYPQESEPANVHHSQKLIELFDEGLQMVMFLGHGGRYIWRTGPPDLKKNHDLFTLDHLDMLKPNTRLPVVLSLTCYSAPFDHPSADSIGEKLIRMPDKGAIGVFAASWRNSPSSSMGQKFVEGLRDGGTIGDAVLKTKENMNNLILLQTYNLLGDPAVPVAMPQHTIELSIERGDKQLVAHGVIDVPGFSGELVVDFMGVDDQVLYTSHLSIREASFSAELPDEIDTLQCVSVRAYAWNEENRNDAIGWAKVLADEEMLEVDE